MTMLCKTIKCWDFGSKVPGPGCSSWGARGKGLGIDSNTWLRVKSGYLVGTMVSDANFYLCINFKLSEIAFSTHVAV